METPNVFKDKLAVGFEFNGEWFDMKCESTDFADFAFRELVYWSQFPEYFMAHFERVKAMDGAGAVARTRVIYQMGIADGYNGWKVAGRGLNAVECQKNFNENLLASPWQEHDGRMVKMRIFEVYREADGYWDSVDSKDGW